MKIEELNVEYDKLQKIYGAKELMSIYNGGCTFPIFLVTVIV